MIKNITIGQYLAGNSILHKVTPKTKFFLTFLYIFLLFFFKKIMTYFFAFFVIIALYKVCKIPIKVAFNNLKSIAFILLFTSILNLCFGKEGEVVFSFLFLKITKNSLITIVSVVFRIFCLIVGVAILTYTTLPLDLARSIGDFFKPLKKFNFPAEEVSMMLSISIRFVPLLISEMQKIMFAQKSRGADVESGNVFKKIRYVISILVPLLVSSFKRAEDLSVAMESRCYKIGGNRTRYITFKFSRFDAKLLVMTFIFVVCLFIVEFFAIF